MNRKGIVNTMSSTNGKRTVKCSVCNLTGHNKKTCPSASVPPVAAPAPPVPPAVAEVDHQSPVTEHTVPDSNKEESPKQYMCGHCKLLLGADHRNCLFTRYNCSVEEWEAALIPVSSVLPSTVTVRAKNPVKLPNHFLLDVVEDNGDDVSHSYSVFSNIESLQKKIVLTIEYLYSDFLDEEPVKPVPTVEEIKTMYLNKPPYSSSCLIMKGGEAIGSSCSFGYEIRIGPIKVDGI